MICLVTDRHRLGRGAEAADRLVDIVAGAARAGIDLVQVRERDMSAAVLADLVRRCVEAVQGTSTKLLVNDRTDVALAAGAHGVHLRGDSPDVLRVRALLPDDAWVGRSVHRVAEIDEADRTGGLDYLIFGTVFRTPSKPPGHSTASPEGLAEACRRTRIPVLGIGGVTVENAQLLRNAGAAGVAGIGLFVPPPGAEVSGHLRAVTEALRRVFDTKTFDP